MSKFYSLHTYKDVVVSGVDYDFSTNPHENIPHRLYADWAQLIVKLTKAVFPLFEAAPFPESLEFQTELIHSDDPYRSDPDFYTLDYVSCQLKAENGYGLNIHFENGRWSGGDPVTIETRGLNNNVSSYIYKDEKSPLAGIYIWHGEDQRAEIKEIIARHVEHCLAKSTRIRLK